VLLGVSVALLLHPVEPETYTASARFVLDTTGSQSGAESTAIADTARAIATSSDIVTSAIKQAGVKRDAQFEANHRVAVQALGTSGVLMLTVTDSDPLVAARLANALAAEVIRIRTSYMEGNAKDQLAQVTAQLAADRQNLVKIDSQIAALNQSVPVAGSSSAQRMREIQFLRLSRVTLLTPDLDVSQ
jgi:uncharacterized protein involved in exopolysaccharide biosynthesis